MKKLLFLIAISSLLMMACNNNAQKSNEIIESNDSVVSQPSNEENVPMYEEPREEEYLNLEKTTIDELLKAKGYNVVKDENGSIISSNTFELGNIKLGESAYKLVFENKENEIALNSVNEAGEKFEIFAGSNLDSEISLYNEKYLAVAHISPYNDGINSHFNIFDQNMNMVMENISVYYDSLNHMFDYNFFHDNISFTAYDSITTSIRNSHNIDETKNVYRVYYEIIEKDDVLEINKVKEDFKDLKFTAQQM